MAIVSALGTIGAASLPVLAAMMKWVLAPQSRLEQRIKVLEDEKAKRELANTVDAKIAELMSERLKGTDDGH